MHDDVRTIRSDTLKRIGREFVLIVAAAALIGVFLRTVVFAGSLTPSAAPAATMRSFADLYVSIAGTYDASGVTASATGSAMQIARCAVRKVQGLTCP